ncbi:TLDc domain-containing protein [Entamoeba marina]
MSDPSLTTLVLQLQQNLIECQRELIQTKNEMKNLQFEVIHLKNEVEILRSAGCKSIASPPLVFHEREHEQKIKSTIEDEFSDEERHMSFLFETIKKWCNKDTMSLIYDTDIDGEDNTSFQRAITGKPCLYFILIDAKGNVFGGFNRKFVTRIGRRMDDRNHFIFSLNSNNRIDSPCRWFAKSEKPTTCFYLSTATNTLGRFCEIGTPEAFISVAKTNVRQSGVVTLSNKYEGIDNDDLNDTNNEVFYLDRLLVFGME